mgnify:CR=1 FL=1
MRGHRREFKLVLGQERVGCVACAVVVSIAARKSSKARNRGSEDTNDRYADVRLSAIIRRQYASNAGLATNPILSWVAGSRCWDFESQDAMLRADRCDLRGLCEQFPVPGVHSWIPGGVDAKLGRVKLAAQASRADPQTRAKMGSRIFRLDFQHRRFFHHPNKLSKLR